MKCVRLITIVTLIMATATAVYADGRDSLNEFANFQAAGVVSNAVGTQRWEIGVDCDGDGSYWHDCDDTYWADEPTLTVTVPSGPSISIVAAYLYWSPAFIHNIDWFACDPSANPYSWDTVTVNGVNVNGPVVGDVLRDYSGWYWCPLPGPVATRIEPRLQRADITSLVTPGFNSLTITNTSNGPNDFYNARFAAAFSVVVVYDDSTLLPSERSEIFIADGAAGTATSIPTVSTPPITHNFASAPSDREMHLTFLSSGLDSSTFYPSGVRPYYIGIDAGGGLNQMWVTGIGAEDSRYPSLIKTYDLLAPNQQSSNPAEFITPIINVPAGSTSVTMTGEAACPSGYTCDVNGPIDERVGSAHLLVSVVEIKGAPAPLAIPRPVLLRHVDP